MPRADSKKGLVQVYTGTGKGKTTASIGLGVRAAGHGWKVYMIQFMKGKINYGELESTKLLPNFTIEQFGRPDFVNKDDPEQVDIDFARDGFERAKQIIGSGEYDMVILDEINVAVDFNLLTEEEVLDLVNSRPMHVEIIMTGRYASERIRENADLLSEITEIKHPYANGTDAREGIEF